MAISLTQLKALAAQIKNETVEEANSATRVGLTLENIIDYFVANGGGGTPSGDYQAKLISTFSVQYKQSNAPDEPKGGECWINPTTRQLFAWVDLPNGATDFWLEISFREDTLYKFKSQTFTWTGENLFLLWEGTDPGIVPPATETVELLPEIPSYTILDSSANSLVVNSTDVVGEVILPLNLTASKALVISIDDNSSDVVINAVAYSKGATVFASFDFAYQEWTVTTTQEITIPDYSDIAVKLYSETIVISEISGGYMTSPIQVAIGDLVFINNAAAKADIGVYQVRAQFRTSTVFKKLVAGTSLNTVRVNNGSVYHSEYDGTNLSSMRFRIMAPPVPVTFFKTVANGIIPNIEFQWIVDLKVSQILLNGYAVNCSATINGTVYDKDSLIGIALPTGSKMSAVDISIAAGYDDGSITVIFNQF